MKKAKEVSQLVDELTHFGIPAGNIHLQGVRVETSSGALLEFVECQLSVKNPMRCS